MLYLARAAVWLCVAVCTAAASDFATSFRLVGDAGQDILSEAAAHAERAEAFRPSSNVLQLSFKSRGVTFDYKLFGQRVAPSGGDVVVQRQDGSFERSPLGEHLYFRSPDRDAVLTIVGRKFHGTVRKGSDTFDIEHEHGTPTLKLSQVSELFDEVAGLLPNGSLAESLAPSSRRLSSKTPTKWDNCYDGDDKMHAFKIGVAISSKVWSKYSFATNSDAEAWVTDKIVRANYAFEGQLHIHIVLGQLFIQKTKESSGPSWDQGPTCPMTIDLQLQNFGREWTPPDTSMGLWHLFDDCYDAEKDATSIKKAWVGTICLEKNQGQWYNNGITWVSDGVPGPTYRTFAENMAYNFGANSVKDGYAHIMDYGNNQGIKADMCKAINLRISSCPAFSSFEPTCGNGVVELGEECECASGADTCKGCCGCKTKLETTDYSQCSPDTIGHDGCCTSTGTFAGPSTSCAASGVQGYCFEGKCVIDHVCTQNSAFSEFCGLEANGCKIKCKSASTSNQSCVSISDISASDGSPINSLPDGTACTENGMSGKCSASGTCITGVTIDGQVNTGAPAPPVPHSTETNYTGCVGFKDRGFLGLPDIAVYHGTFKSLDECNTQCLSNHRCHSFIWRSWWNHCELWTRNFIREDLKVTPGYDTWICDARAAGYDFLDADTHKDTKIDAGPHVPTRPRSDESGHTRSSCYKTCKTDPGCHMFTHVEGTGSCQLYSSEVSTNDFVYTPPQDGYTTYVMPCHGRGKICACEGELTHKIRRPCQCNSVSSPYENECDINKYCYNGYCMNWERRLEASIDDFCPATGSPTPAPAPPGETSTTVTTFDGTTTRTWTTRTWTHTTTLKQFVVRVEMKLKSDGTKEKVESATKKMAANKHSVTTDKVGVKAAAIANARRLSSGASYLWRVEYELILDDETTATQHVNIAKTLASNPADTKARLQSSFSDEGLTADTSDLKLEVPDEVEVYQSCYDTDAGVQDPFDDKCDAYKRDKSLCGDYDDADFSSNVMCCACGGGADRQPDEVPTTTENVSEPDPDCVDSATGGALDITGEGCSSYGKDPAHFCGEFDDVDFSSMWMCCVCQPYQTPTQPPPTTTVQTWRTTSSFNFTGYGISGAMPRGLSAMSLLAAACASLLLGALA